MKRYSLSLVLILTVLLAACRSVPPIAQATPFVMSTTAPLAQPAALATQDNSVQPLQPTTVPDIKRIGGPFPELTDDQGKVSVIAQPLNVGSGEEWLKFDLSMNTHSIDLSMDLATLATLTMNNGLYVQAILWDAPRGGHHITGMLVFPASLDGKSVLEGATRMTLVIEDIDVPVRMFTWDLSP